MKLKISYPTERISILGRYEPDFQIPERIVHIDGKLVPPALAKIVLLGVDVATEQYIHLIEQLREECL